MTQTDDPRAELLDVSARLRHVHAEHARTHEGSAVRRKSHTQMDELSAHLERLLASSVPDEADREAWRAHAHHGGPAPDRPAEAVAAEQQATPPDRPSGRRPFPR